ncbi:MAG: DUF72 domain-containing protein [Ignavibacteria bacterium]|nr:DUF72 domain-containing protein [Ignavibacteria bacterium]
MKIYIGTSGWSFPNWVGILYPEGLPQRKWLNYYSQIFNCVEVNATFYRLFQVSTYQNWVKSVDENFKFIIKIPQEISHKKKLINSIKDLDDFFCNIEIIKPKIGLLLLQLPPSFNTSLDVFSEVVSYIRSKFPLAIEFRNFYLNSDDVLNILIENNCVFVNPDSPKYPLTSIVTNRVLYYRLHGRVELHKSSYTEDELKEISLTIISMRERLDEVYVIFNNGMVGHSISNAIKLQYFLGIRNEKVISLPKYSLGLGL